jgi:hypothetical protein
MLARKAKAAASVSARRGQSANREVVRTAVTATPARCNCARNPRQLPQPAESSAVNRAVTVICSPIGRSGTAKPGLAASAPVPIRPRAQASSTGPPARLSQPASLPGDRTDRAIGTVMNTPFSAGCTKCLQQSNGSRAPSWGNRRRRSRQHRCQATIPRAHPDLRKCNYSRIPASCRNCSARARSASATSLKRRCPVLGAAP